MIKFLVLFFVASTAYASCDNLYPQGKKIDVPNTIELCNRQYVAVYDARLHRNVFSSELIQTSNSHIERSNIFRADSRVPYVKPSDYINSGYDRGHMAPAGDAENDVEMQETFLMTNMTPQAPKLNRGAWGQFEGYVRKTWTGTYHIITGAVYSETPIMIGRKKDIPVPSGYFKCMVDKDIICYVADNDDNALVHPATVEYVNHIAGFTVLTGK